MSAREGGIVRGKIAKRKRHQDTQRRFFVKKLSRNGETKKKKSNDCNRDELPLPEEGNKLDGDKELAGKEEKGEIVLEHVDSRQVESSS